MLQNQALAMALALAGGYGSAKLLGRIKLPSVTGYILAGLLFSPSLLNLIPTSVNKEFDLVKALGLGLIAFIVGAELEMERIRHISKVIILSSLGLSLATFSLVFSAMLFLARLTLPVALVLGATATATAPAPVITVIKEIGARGPLTKTLLGMVAMADAFAILLFGIISAIVTISTAGSGTQVTTAVLQTLLELLGSVALGLAAGIILVFLTKSITDKSQILVLTISVILFNTGFAQVFHMSPLLVNMTTGFVLANTTRRSVQVFGALERIELPLFIVFFTLAGASLRLDVLVANWQVAIIYAAARTLGVVAGVTGGATLAQADKKLKPYLGISLLSKAGVTIGLILLVQVRFPEIAPVVTAVELAAITIFEVVGPVITRYSLCAAGEAAGEMDRVTA